MSWLILLGFLLLLSIPGLLQKRADRKHRKRIQAWRKNSRPIRRGDSIDLMLRTFSVERETKPSSSKSPPTTDEWQQKTEPVTPEQQPASEQERLQQSQTAVATKINRVLPLPEYHWLKKNHRLNIQAARQQLEQLREYVLTVPPDDVVKVVIGTLRRIDPLVFEELLLHCFKEQGYQVVRNERYTGDNGIDGRLYKDGKLYFVQAKRYSGLIQSAHVREFEAVIQKFGADGGFFVHTGRTGHKSRGVFRQAGSKIVLLSGMGVVDLVLSRKVLALTL